MLYFEDYLEGESSCSSPNLIFYIFIFCASMILSEDLPSEIGGFLGSRRATVWHVDIQVLSRRKHLIYPSFAFSLSLSLFFSLSPSLPQLLAYTISLTIIVLRTSLSLSHKHTPKKVFTKSHSLSPSKTLCLSHFSEPPRRPSHSREPSCLSQCLSMLIFSFSPNQKIFFFNISAIEHLPSDLRDRFTDLREMDLSVESK
jgi:hypothetical protein